MMLKCGCKKPVTTIEALGMFESYSFLKGRKFYNIYIIQCVSCYWESDPIRIYSEFPTHLSLYCKIFGHDEVEPIIKDDFNVFFESSNPIDIHCGCKRCGAILGSFENYNRLQKMKKLMKK